MPIGKPSDIFKGEFSNVSWKVAISILLAPKLGALSPLMAEFFGVVIPTRKQERFEKLLKLFFSKLLNISLEEIEQKINEADFENFIEEAFNQKVVKKKFYSPEFIDIFEDVSHQAVKALTNEKLEYLASILEKSLKEEQIKHLQTKRLLSIFGEINDIEVIILQSYDLNKQKDKKFKEKHRNIFQNEFITTNSSEEVKEQNAMFQQYKNHLINLGLIGTTNSVSSSTLYLTKLGGMLLKKIGLEEKPTAIGKPISPLTGINVAATRAKEIQQKIDKSKPARDSFRKSESQKEQELAEKVIRGFRNM